MLIEKDQVFKNNQIRGVSYGKLKAWENGVVPITFHQNV